MSPHHNNEERGEGKGGEARRKEGREVKEVERTCSQVTNSNIKSVSCAKTHGFSIGSAI